MRKLFKELRSTVEGIFGPVLAILVMIVIVILIASILPFIVGWSLIAIIGLFGTVTVSGYFSYVGIGIAVLILAAILK